MSALTFLFFGFFCYTKIIMANNEVKTTSKAGSKESINWQNGGNTKREFSSKWYLAMVVGFVALVALAIFLIKSWSFVVLLVVAALALVVFIKKPSQATHYSLSSDGVSVDGVNRPFDQFKSFGVVDNLNGSHRIILIPVKRFSPALEIDFSEADGEKIVDFLGARMPMKEVKLNFIDSIVQRIGL